jgi:hypothetical protein
MSDNQAEGAVSLRIIRGPLDSLSLYEITDYELDVLEEGLILPTFSRQSPKLPVLPQMLPG